LARSNKYYIAKSALENIRLICKDQNITLTFLAKQISKHTGYKFDKVYRSITCSVKVEQKVVEAIKKAINLHFIIRKTPTGQQVWAVDKSSFINAYLGEASNVKSKEVKALLFALKGQNADLVPEYMKLDSKTKELQNIVLSVAYMHPRQSIQLLSVDDISEAQYIKDSIIANNSGYMATINGCSLDGGVDHS